MPRVKIKIPSDEVFKTNIEVRVDDINYGGHMGNDAILKFAHEVRLRYMNTLNMNEMSFFDNSLIMSDAAVAYKNEVFMGETLSCHLFIDEITNFGLDFIYQFKNKDAEITHIVKTGMLFFNYKTRKISKASNSFKEKFNVQ